MQRIGADMGSQVDMYICTDACANSNQGKGTEVGSLRHNHSPTQGHPGFHITIQRGEADIVSQVDMYICTDACTHFNQGVGPQVGWLGHTHTYCHIEAPRFPYNYSKGWNGHYKQVDIYTCTDALHTLIKVWDHKQGDWDTHTVTHTRTHVSM